MQRDGWRRRYFKSKNVVLFQQKGNAQARDGDDQDPSDGSILARQVAGVFFVVIHVVIINRNSRQS